MKMTARSGSRFAVTELPLPGLKRINRRRITDDRGYFSRLFCAEELAAAGWAKPILQINHAFTARRGTVRGMHYQRPPAAEMKLVTCLRGKIWDVAVDLRAGSGTFLHWYAEHLSADNGCALLIPEGFAHGFQALSDDVELLYCHTAVYSAAAEAGVNPLDPRVNIPWPLPIGEISKKDGELALLNDGFAGVMS